MHRIHLKGPWEFEWQGLPVPADHASSGRIRMPTAWDKLFGAHSGTCVFRRWFNRPTNLALAERVCVVFDGVGGAARCRLNGEPIGTIDAGANTARFEITPLLGPRNRLEVELTVSPADCPAGLYAAVALEIG